MANDTEHIPCNFFKVFGPFSKLDYLLIMSPFYSQHNRSFVRCMVSKYLLSVYNPSFQPFNKVFSHRKVFNFDGVSFTNLVFWPQAGLRTLPNPRSQSFSAILPSRSFICLGLI